MKRTFLAKRNALLSSTGVSWGFIALVFSLFALLLRLFAPNFFWQAAAPVFRAADTIAAMNHSFFAGFSNIATLAARNEQLMRENAALTNENKALLKKEVQLGKFNDVSQGILAAVVAFPPESPYDTLVLAAGKNAGVVLGQEAFAEGGVPLGIVTMVTADFARVTLFSAPGIRTHGWVGHENIPLTILGSGAGTMSASLSRPADVTLGDTVFAPGPGMLPIGSVVRIDSDPSSSRITLRIMPKVNPFSLSWVQLRDVGAGILDSFPATSTAL